MSNKLHSLIAESSVCGAVMLDNTALDRITLSQDDFYFDDTRAVFSAIVELHTQSIPCDVITVSEHLEKKKAVDFKTVSDMAINCPTPKNIVAYADIVSECSRRRKIIELTEKIKRDAEYGESSSTEIASSSVGIFDGISVGSVRKKPTSLDAAMGCVLDEMDIAIANNGVVGLKTGFIDLDNRATGLKKETLTIIAGRPGMGKSAFVTNIAVNIVKSGKSCLFVSLEMSESDLTRRILASECGIDSKKIETGTLNDDEWSLITLGIKRLHGLPLFFEGAKSDTVQKIRAKAKEMQREPRGLDLVVVDYLQLITGSNKENRTQEISEISRGLKLLAMELKIPIIALSQLNRSVESRGNKRPLMSDLRESGGIEQDADNIIFIYRDEVYNENSDDKGVAEIIFSKIRNGKIGTIRLTWRDEYCKFDNFTPRDGDFDQWDDE